MFRSRQPVVHFIVSRQISAQVEDALAGQYAAVPLALAKRQRASGGVAGVDLDDPVPICDAGDVGGVVRIALWMVGPGRLDWMCRRSGDHGEKQQAELFIHDILPSGSFGCRYSLRVVMGIIHSDIRMFKSGNCMRVPRRVAIW